MKILGKRVLIRTTASELERTSGLIVPENVKKNFNQATVVKTGDSVTKTNPGDTIIIRDLSGVDIDYQEQPHQIIYEHDIIAII